MDIIKIDDITPDELPFDFNELNKNPYIDRQKENPAGYAVKVKPAEVNLDEFIDEMNTLFQFVYDNSKD